MATLAAGGGCRSRSYETTPVRSPPPSLMGNRGSAPNGPQDPDEGTPDYYALLDVDENATADDIRVRAPSPLTSSLLTFV